jgi:hypothetical protein
MCAALGLVLLAWRRAVPRAHGVPASALTTRPFNLAAEAASPTTPAVGTPAVGTPALGVPLLASTPSEQSFESAKAGLRLHYSANWREKKSPGDLLMLVPAKGPQGRTITLDVPDVPRHLPGAMAIPLIQSGYIDDLRKHHPGLKVEQSQNETFAACKARLVRSAWTQDGNEYTDVALLIVHAERVYILSLDSDSAGYPAVREEMDQIVRGLEWVK